MSEASAEVSASTSQSGRTLQPPPEATFRSWPLVDEPTASIVPLLLLAASALAAYATVGVSWWALVPFLLVLASLWRWYTPATFHIHSQGVDYRMGAFSRRVRWRDVGGCRLVEDGMLLTRDRAASPLLAAWGLFVPFCGKRPEIVALVNFYHRGILSSTQPSRGRSAARSAMEVPSGNSTQSQQAPAAPSPPDDA